MDEAIRHDEFTPQQKEMIEQLRERVSSSLLNEEQTEDNYLIKWLIARNYDLDQTENMLKKHITFLKSHGMEKLTEDYIPNEIFDYFYTTMLGYDKDGSVVRLLHIGASDIRGLCLCSSATDSLRYAFYTLFKDACRQKRERENEKICEKQVYIIDLEGLSWRAIIHRMVVNRALLLLKSYEANYPERLKKVFIVNAPSFFSFIYRWLKSILPQSIISKIEVFSPGDCQAKIVLAELINLSVLPVSAGGERKDLNGDPNCSSLYMKPLGTQIPENMIPTNSFQALSDDIEAKSITVYNRDMFIVEKVVSEPNSMLQWDFQTLNYDIQMGIHFKKDDKGESEEIIPVHRVDSHIIPESGTFMCEKPGIYEIVFDNTYSWITAKEVRFKINVLWPTDQESSH